MEKDTEICGLRLHYKVEGDGEPIVLMHGWGCNLTTLASVEAVALAAGCKVYNIDFPGFGKSAEPHSVWGVEDYTRMLEEFIKFQGIERPMLLGHSFGGRVGILYSSRNPVSKLILVDAAGIKPRRPISYYIKVYSFKAMKRLLRLTLGKKRAAERIAVMRSKAGSSDYNDATPRMKAVLSKVVNEDLKGVMPSIKAPTLLIWGEADTATPLADARVMAKLIPDAGLVSFPGCGHYSFLDNPRQFAAVLDSFLKS